MSAGDYGAAIAALEESIGLLRELGQEREAAQQRVLLAVALARSGDVRRAHGELTALLAPDAATPARHLAGVRLALGDLARHGRPGGGRAALRGRRTGPGARGAAVPVAAVGGGRAPRDRRGRARRGPPVAARRARPGGGGPRHARRRVGRGRRRAAARVRRPAAAAAALGAASVLRGGPDESDLDLANVARDLRAELGERAFAAGRARGAALDVPGALALLEDQLRRR
ncbi:hypothetical protein [Actinomadura sp. CNU-125]|uniref:hypothetical protein n=1 Tax=Actinomadura sp. CNU-125 TaxID=1904961 RepID=UPI001177D9AC|nr:hypothetical protein [Actinomadura sp. CNU-125]